MSEFRKRAIIGLGIGHLWGIIDRERERENKMRHHESIKIVSRVVLVMVDVCDIDTLLAVQFQVLFLASINGFSLIDRDSMTRAVLQLSLL